jgi:hypothetical protein
MFKEICGLIVWSSGSESNTQLRAFDTDVKVGQWTGIQLGIREGIHEFRGM